MGRRGGRGGGRRIGRLGCSTLRWCPNLLPLTTLVLEDYAGRHPPLLALIHISLLGGHHLKIVRFVGDRLSKSSPTCDRSRQHHRRYGRLLGKDVGLARAGGKLKNKWPPIPRQQGRGYANLIRTQLPKTVHPVDHLQSRDRPVRRPVVAKEILGDDFRRIGCERIPCVGVHKIS